MGGGASDGTRTHGIQDHNLALYQLSYARHRKGWVCGVLGWRRQHVRRANNGGFWGRFRNMLRARSVCGVIR
jgi:hypothetical protein